MIISNLVPAVVSKLRQRTDIAPFVPYYIAQALIDISQNTEFEDLKATGPLVAFTSNVAEYTIIGNPFIYPTDYRFTFIDSWFVYFTTGTYYQPGLSTGKEIDKRDLRVVEPMSKILGLPSVYTVQGSNKNNGRLIVGMMPDQAYMTQMRYQRQHPFNIPYSQVVQAQGNADLANKLGQSEVLIPDDWTDIIVYYAAEKACDDIGMNEIGQQYHQKLFGYKDKRGNSMPGMITAKQTEEERNTLFNSRALRPIVRRYC